MGSSCGSELLGQNLTEYPGHSQQPVECTAEALAPSMVPSAWVLPTTTYRILRVPGKGWAGLGGGCTRAKASSSVSTSICRFEPTTGLARREREPGQHLPCGANSWTQNRTWKLPLPPEGYSSPQTS